jgi:hypothetical protein
MESGSHQLPLKVCRHCSVASRTEAGECPSCGRSYGRRGLQWRWWYAIPIVALAFAGGYFGLSQLVYDDDEPAAVTEEEATAVQPGTSRADVEEELGAPEGEFANDSVGRTGEGAVVSCTYYELADQPERAWQFCFQGDVLATSEAVDLPAD